MLADRYSDGPPEKVPRQSPRRRDTGRQISSFDFSDGTLSTEDEPLGYKQPMEVEKALGTMKMALELRPILDRQNERIPSHVLLCFFAFLLLQIAERETGKTWDRIRSVTEPMSSIGL